MRTADGPDRPASIDPYATRLPSPESREAMDRSGGSIPGDEEPPAPATVFVAATLDEFERGMIEQGLMEAEAVRAFRQGLPPTDPPLDVEDLARALVRDGRLTRYQASALFQGKARALRIGPYVVLDKLGAGGMGMVFKARREDGAEVALKLLPPSASRRDQSVQRFRREAEIMSRLDHPNIVTSYEIGEFGGVHYLVMDYVPGRDLDRVVRSGGPLRVARAVDLILQAARGLRAAHGLGVVHRDIKPANLLLDAEGNVRVLDLGLARIALDGDPLQGSGDGPSLTQSGVIMGTVDFLPPEQSDDSKRADHRADVYSLGCTLHYLLTGKPPFWGETVMQRLIAHHHKPVPSLRAARPEVTPELDALFGRMLAKSPEDRPQSMGEVIEGLEAIQAAPSSRGLRIFDDGGAKTTFDASPAAGDPPPTRISPGEISDGLVPKDMDLMTFVRLELPTPHEEGPKVEARGAVPPLRRRSRRNRRRPFGIAMAGAGLVLATLGVVAGIVASRAMSVRPGAVALVVKPAERPAPPPPVVHEPNRDQSPPTVAAVPTAPEPIAIEPPKAAPIVIEPPKAEPAEVVPNPIQPPKAKTAKAKTAKARATKGRAARAGVGPGFSGWSGEPFDRPPPPPQGGGFPGSFGPMPPPPVPGGFPRPPGPGEPGNPGPPMGYFPMLQPF